MANDIDWGKAVNNDIGWGALPVNDIGEGSVYAVSNFGETLGIKESVLYPSLISYFRLDDNVDDQVGLISATQTGGSYVTGKSGNAWVGGANNSIDFNVNNLIGGKAAFSLSGFFKIGGSIIYANWAGGDERSILFRNNPLQVFLYNGTDQGGGTFVHSVIYGTVFNHIVLTYDGTDIKLYLNGVKSVTEYPLTGTIKSSLGTEKLNNQSSNYGSNTYDGVGIWDKALNQTEVTDIFTIQNNGNDLI